MGSPITYDRRSFKINGQPVLILSGSVHYIRLHPSRWDQLFETFLNAKLNTVETYVFWGEHDPSPPVTAPTTPSPSTAPPSTYDFTGRRDLFSFIAAAGAKGLHVILRIGPYVCAEASYGGFPFRLRNIPGIEFRTFNAPFMAEVEAWVRHVASVLHADRLLASHGGPVILVQLENEYEMVSDAYGDAGAKYLQWCADLQRELDFGVPAIMCYGAADGVVETINSFYAHEEIVAHRARHPDQPPVWTECWTGWYDVWGSSHHRRSATDLAYAVARFFAQGGAGVNYYMWMGGTNFGRTPMYLQATSYSYDAPIDEYYQPTTKSNYLTALHNVLLDSFALSFHANREEDPVCEDGNVYRWGDTVFVCNDSDVEMTDVKIKGPQGGLMYTGVVRGKSVHIVDGRSGKMLFDTACVKQEHVVTRQLKRQRCTITRNWEHVAEPIPTADTIKSIAKLSGGARDMSVSEEPMEQLRLTQDSSDYCFYTARFRPIPDVRCTGTVEVIFEAADYAHVFFNGKAVGRSAEPLWEDRWPNKWNAYDSGEEAPGTKHVIKAKWDDDGEVNVTILVASLGLVKGDWQLGTGRNMLHERKGLLSQVMITSEEKPVFERCSPWSALPKLHGEVAGYPNKFSATGVPGWEKQDGPAWYRCTVHVEQVRTNWVIELGQGGKGLFFVNGVYLGRYWDVKGGRPRNGFLDGSPVTQDFAPGECTQRFYHVPAWVISDAGKGEDCSEGVELEVVLFSEYGGAIEEFEIRCVE